MRVIFFLPPTNAAAFKETAEAAEETAEAAVGTEERGTGHASAKDRLDVVPHYDLGDAIT
jgi:hypothetical protein